MKNIPLIITLCGAVCLGQVAIAEGPAQYSPMVSVHAGKLRGTRIPDGGAVFKGIPFAQPPTGDLRWRAPQPAKSWSGVRDASDFGPPCVQGGALGVRSSEDCLYLNVWTPKWPMEKPAAVMVWIYGGGNFAGAASDPTFDGESLARHGVILVTINYRVGVFGFFELPDLDAESPHHVSGNYGLLDQIMALRWVHDNIARFGGDPGNVTIFGESAGSLDINVLMTSPLGKGLYRRVIGESGPVVAPPLLAEGERKDEALVAKLNISGGSVLKKLRDLSSAELERATGQGLAFIGPTLGVVVDGWIFPESPMESFAAGREQRAGLMLGTNSQELQKPFFPMSGGLRDAIKNQYGPLAERALAVYGLNGTTQPQPDPEFGSVLAQWATDSQFRCGSVAELVWHTKAQNSGYQFQFSRAAPGREALGAPHGSEVPYVFGTLGVGLNPRKYDATDQRISAEMEEYWTNFAKTGDPNGGTLPQWPKFNPSERAYLDFTNAGPIARKGLRRQTCNLYIEQLQRQLGYNPQEARTSRRDLVPAARSEWQ
jgi:para-nitrobenzyl esterase